MKIKTSLIKKLKKLNSSSNNIPTHYDIMYNSNTLMKDIILNDLQSKVDIFLYRF